MMAVLLEPFGYGYMVTAIWVSALVGGLCAFLSVFLMLKGWSLIGDALSHSIVPVVAGAYMLGLPFAVGAFLSGGLAAAAMLALAVLFVFAGLKSGVVRAPRRLASAIARLRCAAVASIIHRYDPSTNPYGPVIMNMFGKSAVLTPR